MYIPEPFTITNQRKQLDVIREIGWGHLTSIVEGIPYVTHLPLLLEDENDELKLVAHMARANPHWKSFSEGSLQLVVFEGPHCYISPNWYVSKKAVPTWNYVTAHVYGEPRIIEDPDYIRTYQKKLVDKYEEQQILPWRLESLDKVFINDMSRAIVTFEIQITHIECKLKLSQNRSSADRESVISALEATGKKAESAIASLMRKLNIQN